MQGPFEHTVEGTSTYTLYLLKFLLHGSFYFEWRYGRVNLAKMVVNVKSIRVSDDFAIDIDPKPKNPTAQCPTAVAILPANYTVKYRRPRRNVANIMFVVPNDLPHCQCVLIALETLGYSSSNKRKFFFLSKNKNNVLLITEEILLLNREYCKFFNEYLLFVLGEGDIRCVSRVRCPQQQDNFEFKPRVSIGGNAATLDLNELSSSQQTLVQFVCEKRGTVTLSNDSPEDLTTYLRSWLFKAAPKKQRDIYVSIKVKAKKPHNFEEVVSEVISSTQQHIAQSAISLRTKYHSSVVIVISGTPDIWAHINLSRKALAEDLARQDLELSDIWLTNVKDLTKAMKDPLNKPYQLQMFDLICEMQDILTHNEHKLPLVGQPNSTKVLNVNKNTRNDYPPGRSPTRPTHTYSRNLPLNSKHPLQLYPFIKESKEKPLVYAFYIPLELVISDQKYYAIQVSNSPKKEFDDARKQWKDIKLPTNQQLDEFAIKYEKNSSWQECIDSLDFQNNSNLMFILNSKGDPNAQIARSSMIRKFDSLSLGEAAKILQSSTKRVIGASELIALQTHDIASIREKYRLGKISYLSVDVQLKSLSLSEITVLDFDAQTSKNNS